MGKSRASVLNMAVTLVWQLCTVVFGLVVPRYFLVGYGADIHGLTSTISNILSYVLLLNGDTFFEIDFRDFLARHRAPSRLRLALTLMQNTRYGSIELDSEGFITRFSTDSSATFSPDSTSAHSLINAGVYSLSRDIFEGFCLPKIFSFEDFIAQHYGEILASGEVYEARFIDIGIPQDYLRAQSYLSGLGL